MKKIEGVQSAEVSLNEGVARIWLKPGNRVPLEKIREVVINNGFTPREARVQVQGKVISADGEVKLQVTDLDRVYDLMLAAKARKTQEELEKQVGKVLSVEGLIPAPKGKGPSQILEVNDFKEDQ